MSIHSLVSLSSTSPGLINRREKLVGTQIIFWGELLLWHIKNKTTTKKKQAKNNSIGLPAVSCLDRSWCVNSSSCSSDPCPPSAPTFSRDAVALPIGFSMRYPLCLSGCYCPQACEQPVREGSSSLKTVPSETSESCGLLALRTFILKECHTYLRSYLSVI